MENDESVRPLFFSCREESFISKTALKHMSPNVSVLFQVPRQLKIFVEAMVISLLCALGIMCVF